MILFIFTSWCIIINQVKVFLSIPGGGYMEKAYLVLADGQVFEGFRFGSRRDSTGELVFTTLTRTGTPMLRYRTRDLTRIIPGTCECGRTLRRLDRMKGRTDDMLIISGVNVFPSQIEGVLMGIPEVGNNYQIVVDRQANLDRLHVRVELYAKMFTGDVKALEKLKASIVNKLKSVIVVTPRIEFCEPGTLPVSMGKAVRVIDNRKI